MALTILQQSLAQRLLLFISDNNPDLLLQLEADGQLTNFLTTKIEGVSALLESEAQPTYALEEACIDVMTADLLPSKYNFVCAVLEEEFEEWYWQLQSSGLLKFEAVNILAHSQPVFDAMHFGEATEGNRLLHYAIAGTIAEYFEKSQREQETVSHGVQQPA